MRTTAASSPRRASTTDVHTPTLSRHGTDAAPVLVWRWPRACRSISSAVVGGGIGAREWLVNAQVARDYARTDLDAHLFAIAGEHRCTGNGIGMLTAADV